MPNPAPAHTAAPVGGVYTLWLQAPGARRMRGRARPVPAGGTRFAFYGRISTERFQDPVSSRAWQLEAAGRLVAGRGHIVIEFFDTAASRSLPWPRRPEAAALLAAAADPDREFDAVVVAEFERAFAAGQAETVIAQLNAYGVQVWLPEARGPVDLSQPEHRALLKMLGHQSEREVLRNRSRTTAAMAAQVREQGRMQGGRPPYGYQLVDAGPHPNVVHAMWGRRQRRLDIDPVTAPHVRWIFARRLEGFSQAAIARMLNERRVPSPGAYDRIRNPHRQQTVWTLRTVAALLANPRYTGRQVWNRQYTDHREAVPGDRRSSLGPVRVWSDRSDWVISRECTHPALVTDEDFALAQRITTVGLPDDGKSRRYALTGLLVCAVCERRLDGHWVHGNPGYRCRHGATSAHRAGEGPTWVYWSQARLFRQLRDAHRDVALLGDAQGLAAYLRAGDLVVVCGQGALMIEATANVGDEPEPIVDEPENQHPQQLPLPLSPPSRTGRSTQKKARVPRQVTKDETPRYHMKRE